MIKRRKLIQLASAVVYNLNIKGFARGRIYTGGTKGVCVPGLNCYSCPGAIGACPLGSLQSSFSDLRYKVPLYVVGLIVLFGALMGRAICAFLCPFGLIQELIYKIPSPKLKKSAATRKLSYMKFAILAVFVFILPLFYVITKGAAVPTFCKYICPAGTLEGGIILTAMNENLRALTGALFNWKVFLLVVFFIASIFIYRPFCRFVCPLGAIYAFFNKSALFGVKVDALKCNGCGLCVKSCKTDARKINDFECIRCGECSGTCKRGAITFAPNMGNIKKGEVANVRQEV